MRNRHHRSQAGFTLVEIMLVVFAIVALLGLLSLALGPVRDVIYKALCISNQSTIQDAVKTYAAGNNLDPGNAVASTLIIGTGLLVPTAPVCRKSGTYTYTGVVPAAGVKYASCSVATHVPTSTATW